MISANKIGSIDFLFSSSVQGYKEGNEWLETNGLGGWAGSTITGVNTRRYHGLLVAATDPPTGRTVLVSKLEETIVTGDERIELGVNLYPGNIVHPQGHRFLDAFRKDLFPEWEYDTGTIRLKKTIAMIHGENTVVIQYEVLKAESVFVLELLPLMAARNYHSLEKERTGMHWDVDFESGLFHNKPDGKTDCYISVAGSAYHHQPRWFRNFQYSVEQYRGLDHTEDLFNHGTFSVALKQGDSLSIIVSTSDPTGRNAEALMRGESARRESLLQGQPQDTNIRQLILAADQFIVKRDINVSNGTEKMPVPGATIIAGYHWFTDWGRDTMISLPGLCLSTGRFDDAKKILAAFAASADRGMLPNRFTDNGDQPEYNTVDGTLWYFIAVYKYLQATDDKGFVLDNILPVLKQIIDWHFKGTRYNIRVDADGLLFAGERGQQLTWMDARVGDWVVTPRMGKPVEIQALWYNALRIFAALLELNGQQADAMMVNLSAEQLEQSFANTFWFEEGNYLYDLVDEHGRPDPTLRPNQLFAISLPFTLLDAERAASVLDKVESNLYTPVGLRTLPADDKRYVSQYGGDQWHRDASYHQGTVWSWLLGPFVDCIMKLKGDDHRLRAQDVIQKFTYHLNEAGTGTVSEIFDADAPHHPRGCIAQAWGVAELLRVIKDYQLHAGAILS